MADTTDQQHDGATDEQSLSDRLLDLFVFLPTGLVVTVAEELPRLAERGRERLGVHVNSARAVGEFAVTAGGQELKKRSSGRGRAAGRTGSGHRSSRPATDARQPHEPGRARPASAPSRTPRTARRLPHRPPRRRADRTAGTRPDRRRHPDAADRQSDRRRQRHRPGTVTARPPVDAHTPDVASLAIPAFDTLSASQVVQRLDGLSRSELVAVRAYETSTRGRRTILSRVDQLLDERS